MIQQQDTVLDEITYGFPDHSRVWVYQSSRPFSESEHKAVSEKLQGFNENWESHGQPVKSVASVLYGQFIVFAIDDTPNKAGGCSIDTSVHLMKQLEKDYNIELFNRLQVVAFSTEGQMMNFKFSDTTDLLKQGILNADSTIFNNAISSVKELKDNWQIPLKESWLKKYL